MASNGLIRVSTFSVPVQSSLESVTAERRHNLLRVALATRHSNQRKIQQMAGTYYCVRGALS